MLLNDTPKWADRFWAKVDRTGDCWIWTACRSTKGGYGFFGIDGKNHVAHRVAWELEHGPIPDGLFVCHNCPSGDNPSCVRPSHMFLGTASDNMQDAAHKGRMANGTRNGKYTKPERTPRGDDHHARRHPERLNRGEDRPAAKLTEGQVRQIRQRYAAGGITQKQLASEFGISTSTMNTLIKGKGWKHVR